MADHWRRIKEKKELSLDGVTIDVESIGGNISRIKLTDAKGKVLLIERENDYSGIKVYLPSEPKKKKVHRVEYLVCGEKAFKDFEDSYEAHEFKSKVDAEISHSNPTLSEVEVDDGDAL